jgi:hypothetical protein
MTAINQEPAPQDADQAFSEGRFEDGFLLTLDTVGRTALTAIGEELHCGFDLSGGGRGWTAAQFWAAIVLDVDRYVGQEPSKTSDRLQLAHLAVRAVATTIIALEDPLSRRRGNEGAVFWERMTMALMLGEVSALLDFKGGPGGITLDRYNNNVSVLRKRFVNLNAAASWWHELALSEWRRIGHDYSKKTQCYKAIERTLKKSAKGRSLPGNIQEAIKKMIARKGAETGQQ